MGFNRKWIKPSSPKSWFDFSKPKPEPEQEDLPQPKVTYTTSSQKNNFVFPVKPDTPDRPHSTGNHVKSSGITFRSFDFIFWRER